MTHEFTDEITCPYCDHEHQDSFEFNEDHGNQNCSRCEREFTVTRDVDITYTTTKLEED